MIRDITPGRKPGLEETLALSKPDVNRNARMKDEGGRMKVWLLKLNGSTMKGMLLNLERLKVQ
jgi:hypothetical protein